RRAGALHGERRGRGARRARAQDPSLGLEGLRDAVLRRLQAIRRRLLQDRPTALQPRGGVANERAEREDVPRGTPQPRGAARVARRELTRHASPLTTKE